MNADTYYAIVKIIRNHGGLSKDCLPLLKRKFEKVNNDTLTSIISHEYRKRMKVNHNKSLEMIQAYYGMYWKGVQRGDKPGIILNIALQFDVTPCLVAKMILEKYFNDSTVLSDSDCKAPINVKIYLRDTSLIPDPTLAYEVYLCTLYDDQYSPTVETMKTSLGQEYEIRLYREMASLGLAFRDEEHLRKYGYDKTPDVKLELPIAIDGFIINWVESKALFGDEEVHKEYMQNQYLSYWNRFGSGLVIYWFGFVETLLQANDKRIIIHDHFPSNVTHIIPPKCEEIASNVK